MHLAIIMDGNRRWGEKKGLPVFEGHRHGAEKIKEVTRWCIKRRIEILTLFAFSTENWKRAEKEVGFFMDLAEKFIIENIKELHKEGVRVRFYGERKGIPKALLGEMGMTEALTVGNNRIVMNILFNYGGRAEIVEAVKKIVAQGFAVSQIDETKIAEYLYTAGLPDPNLIIRTSGERRLSNFLTWQSVYSELYFTERYWPDFSEKDLDGALAEYARRQRRFGR